MSLLQKYKDLNLPSIKWDTYLEHFDKHLTKYIGTKPNVLEIGIANGGSLELWAKIFENPKIYGVDADEKVLDIKFEYPDTSVILGDQGNPDFWDNFVKDKPLFDVIIDDGSHVNSDQITTLLKLFPHVAVGGTYIIEDTHTSYWPEWGGGFRREDSFVELCKMLVDFLHRQHIKEISPPPQLTYVFNNLKSITFYNSMVILEKEIVTDMVPLSSEFLKTPKNS